MKKGDERSLDSRSTPQKTAILRFLLESGDSAISGNSLCRSLGCTRQAIWKNIRSLLSEGFRITGKPHEGYRLESLPEYDLAPSLIAASMGDAAEWNGTAYLYESVSSTQLVAKELARKGAAHGTVILAENQYQGRGRLDRSWTMRPAEGIAMSVVLSPRLKPHQVQLVNLAAGMAVQKAIEEETHVRYSLKWPNDVLFSGRKISGILSEASLDQDRVLFVVTGIGINVNTAVDDFPKGLSEYMTSLKVAAGKSVHRGYLAARVLTELLRHVRRLENDTAGFLNSYRASCSSLGQDVLVNTGEEECKGKVLGICDTGELIVSTRDGVRQFAAADVVHASFPALRSSLL